MCLSGSLRRTFAYINVAEVKPTRWENHQKEVLCVDLSGSRRIASAYIHETHTDHQSKNQHGVVYSDEVNGSLTRTLSSIPQR